jgi:hypothetical protein
MPWNETGRKKYCVIRHATQATCRMKSSRSWSRLEQGDGARAAYGPTAEAEPGAAERSTAAARRCDAHGTGKELQRRCGDDFEADGMSDNSSNEPRPPKLIGLAVARVARATMSVLPIESVHGWRAMTVIQMSTHTGPATREGRQRRGRRCFQTGRQTLDKSQSHTAHSVAVELDDRIDDSAHQGGEPKADTHCGEQ